MKMKKLYTLFTFLIVISFLVAACQPTPVDEPTPVVPTEPIDEPTEPPVEPTEPMDEPTEPPVEPTEPPPTPEEVIFFSTQFVPVEEQERFRTILQEAGFDFVATEEGPMIDLVRAGAAVGQAELDVVGALHGTFPPITDAMMNLVDVLDDLSADREFPEAFVETGLLGTSDYLYYIPWMQATYIMAAHTDALEFLPDGANLDAMTWEQFSDWCRILLDETGSPKCGVPHAGLFHRFLQGYLWPSFTGGMVSQFRSQEAADMLTWARDELWPTMHPQSISYEFMQEPLLTGEVWVAFDHTARLIEAFTTQPEDFVAFPAPSGAFGLGFMPVIVGLGIPLNAPNQEGAIALIEYLTQPDIQERVLRELAFFPVVAGVDFTDLPQGVAIEAGAVEAQANAPNALPALLPVGLGERSGEINLIFRNAFDRVVLDGDDISTVLQEEGAALQELMEDTGAPCWPPDPPSVGPCPVE
jgi:multiple sugar transport system substrate-binding protein